MTKDFALAAQSAADIKRSEEVVEFTLGGEGPYYSHIPDETQLAIYMAAFTDGNADIDIMAETMSFLKEVFEEDTFKELKARLMDRRDPVKLETLLEILEWIIEEYTARPTKPSSDSTPSQRSTGARSTASLPPKASTRSRSTRSGSAT